MKYKLLSILGLILIPSIAFGFVTTVPWARLNGSGVYPLYGANEQVFVGETSTTTRNIFEVNGTSFFGNGFISNASSTMTSNLFLTSLLTGALYVDGFGQVRSDATTSTSVAYQDVWRDGNANILANNFFPTVLSTVSNGGTVVMTPASARYQILTGSSNHTYQQPNGNASGMTTGATWDFNNNSSGILTVTTHGGVIIATVPPGGFTRVILTDNSTSEGSWETHAYLGHNSVSGTGTLGLGTSSPAWLLQVSSSTASNTFKPQFAISDQNSASGLKHLTFSYQGGNFYIATATDQLATSSNSALTINANGWLGIASTTPGYPLSISGGWLTTASSTGMNGIDLTRGCFSIRGTCISGGGGSGTVTSITNGTGLVNNGTSYTTTGTITAGVGTSTNPTIGNIAMWSSTGSGATTATLHSVATNTPTATGITTLTGTGATIGALTINTLYDAFTHPYQWISATTSSMSFGTTTISNSWSSTLTLSSTTSSQLGLFGGGGLPGWIFRNNGGNLSIATTTIDGTATTSIDALRLNNSGQVLGQVGSASLPTFSFVKFPTTGIFTDGTLRFAQGGTDQMDISNVSIGMNLRQLNVDGSLSAPAISFTGNTQTGLFNVSGALGFDSVGVEAARFDTIGNFGLGTTTPKWKLTVASTTGPQIALVANPTDNGWTLRSIGNQFYISTSSPTTFATSSATALTIDNNANFGIGSSTPTYRVSVGGTIVANGGQIVSTFASTTGGSSSPFLVDWSKGTTQRYTLTANSAFIINATSSNPIDGGKYILKLCQDGTGSRTVTFATGNLSWYNGTTTATTTPNTATWIGMVFDAHESKYNVLASTTVPCTP